MSIELQFLGAARHVIGTEHLLCIGDNQVFVVHGEDDPAEAMAQRLRSAGFADVAVPSKYERHTVR